MSRLCCYNNPVVTIKINPEKEPGRILRSKNEDNEKDNEEQCLLVLANKFKNLNFENWDKSKDL